jgi:hypothetical protein
MAGAVFCRTCGEKMNFDNLRPEDFTPPEGVKGTSSVLVRMFGVTILLLFILAPVLCLLPVSGDGASAPVEEKQLDDVRRRLRLVLKVKREQEITFTQDEINAIANPLLGFPGKPKDKKAEPEAGRPEVNKPETDKTRPEKRKRAPEAGKDKPEDGKKAPEGGKDKMEEGKEMLEALKKMPPVRAQSLQVTLLPDATLKVVFKSLLYGKVPFYTTLRGRIETPEKGPATFNVESVIVGRLPLLGVLQEKGLTYLCVIPKNRKLLPLLLARIASFECEDGTAKVKTVATAPQAD